jgi:hypothetical protein
MACFLLSGYKFYWVQARSRLPAGRQGTSLIGGRVFLPVDEHRKVHWRSVAVQFVLEAENSQGAEFLLRSAVRIRVPGLLPILINGSESCKKHDKQLTFIVRVMCRVVLKLS